MSKNATFKIFFLFAPYSIVGSPYSLKSTFISLFQPAPNKILDSVYTIHWTTLLHFFNRSPLCLKFQATRLTGAIWYMKCSRYGYHLFLDAKIVTSNRIIINFSYFHRFYCCWQHLGNICFILVKCSLSDDQVAQFFRRIMILSYFYYGPFLSYILFAFGGEGG